jgi:hypothetical protein
MSGLDVRRVGRGSDRDIVNEWVRGERAAIKLVHYSMACEIRTSPVAGHGVYTNVPGLGLRPLRS